MSDVVGMFKILDTVAVRGMAQVFRASRRDEPEKVVALKMSKTSLDLSGDSSELRQRYQSDRNAFLDLIRREAEVLSELIHPGIVRVHPMDMISNPGTITFSAKALEILEHPWYFVMEYVEGQTLAQHLEDKTFKSYPMLWKLELFYQILMIVNYIHERGYAHCDLKPENIILRGSPHMNTAPQPVLIDFGTVSQRDQLTTDPAVTIAYGAPEMLRLMYTTDPQERQRLRDTIIPQKLDIWALGVILFEIMTDDPFVTGEDHHQITTILNHSFKRIRDLNGAAPENLDRFLEKLLARDPRYRPPANQLMQAIDFRIAAPPRIIRQLDGGPLRFLRRRG